MNSEFEKIAKNICDNDLFGITLSGTATTGERVYISEGIRQTYGTMDADDIKKALAMFTNGDFNTFYEADEHPTPANEYGEYPSKYGDTTDTGAIMIHRERGYIVVYYQFER